MTSATRGVPGQRVAAVVLGLAVAALMAGLAAPRAADAATGVRLLDARSAGPPQSPLVVGKRVQLRAHGVRAGFSARLGAREVTARFRGRGRTRTAVLVRGRDFGRGANRLVVGSGRDGARRYSATRFVAGRRARGTLRIRRVTERAGNRSALRIRVATRGRRFGSLEVRLNGTRVRTRDWVVGSRTPSSRWPLGRRRFEALLGADNGLRYGRNRLAVTAWRPDGSFDRVVRRLRISRTAPLASAGRGSSTSVGRRVVLDGRRTRVLPRHGRMRYRWRIIDAPRGSKAKLRRAGGTRPLLVPDRPGSYRIRLAVRRRATGARGRAATAALASLVAVDQTTVEATPPTPPIGLPIDTIAGSNGIELNGTTYPMPEGKTWAQLLVLDRRTLEVKSNQGFGSGSSITLDAVQGLESALGELDTTDLVVVSGGGRQTGDWLLLDLEEFRTAITSAFSAAGAGPQFSSSLDWNLPASLEQGSWSLIGVPNIAGSADANLFGMINGATAGGGSAPGALTGYLQQDAQDNYAFASPETTTIDTNAPGSPQGANSVRVGSDVYSSDQLAEGESGFQVLVLDSLLRPTRNETFATNTCCSFDFVVLGQMQKLIADAADLGSGSPGYLVVVQSIGTPRGLGGPYANETQWVDDGVLARDAIGDRENTVVPRDKRIWSSSATGQSLAGALGGVGGPAAHDQIAQMVAVEPQPNPPSQQGYTLVASTGMLKQGKDGLLPVDTASVPVTRSQALSHTAKARVIGTLSRDRQALWTLDSGSAAQGFDNGTLAELLYQQPAPWPLSKTKAQRAANAYIARQLGFDAGDVRVAYYEDSGQDWSAVAGQLRSVGYPSGGSPSFGRASFTALKAQLQKEIGMVGEVQALIDDWQRVFTSSTVSGYIDLQAIAGDVLAEVERLDARASTTSRTDAIVTDSLWIASGLLGPVPGVGEALGATAGLVALASTLSEGPNGAPSVAPVTAEAAKLGEQVSTRYEQIQGSMGQVAEILVGDWGKLQRASSLSKNAWEFNDSVRNAVVDSYTRSAKREFYAALLSAVYGIYVVDPPFVMGDPSRTTPASVSCASNDFANEPTSPFGSQSDNPASWLTRPVGFEFGNASEQTKLDWLGLYTPADIDAGRMKHNPDVVPQALSGPLFEPLTESGSALGIDKLSFFADSRFEQLWFSCTAET